MSPPTPALDPWYADPRWWGIIASALIGVFSLGIQAFYRYSDRTKKDRDERFERDIAEDVRSCFPMLRKVMLSVTRIANKTAVKERRKFAAELLDGDFGTLMNDLFAICAVADDQTKPTGERFSDIAAKWEDYFSGPFVEMCAQTDTKKRKTAAKAICDDANKIQLELRRKLDNERMRYVN
jgi:hypothetical protein